MAQISLSCSPLDADFIAIQWKSEPRSKHPRAAKSIAAPRATPVPSSGSGSTRRVGSKKSKAGVPRVPHRVCQESIPSSKRLPASPFETSLSDYHPSSTNPKSPRRKLPSMNIFRMLGIVQHPLAPIEVQANRSSRFVAFGVVVYTAGQDEILKRMRFANA